MGSVQRPSTTRGSVYGERDFRVRQFVSLMGSEILFGMERQQAVALATRITEAIPGRFRLSEPTIEAILDRRRINWRAEQDQTLSLPASRSTSFVLPPSSVRCSRPPLGLGVSLHPTKRIECPGLHGEHARRQMVVDDP